MEESTTRACSKCQIEKPLDDKHYAAQLNGGFRWQCRDCVSASLKAHLALRTHA